MKPLPAMDDSTVQGLAAPSLRVVEAQRAVTRKNFALSTPIRKVEIIARHYASCATLCARLARMCEYAQQGGAASNDALKYAYDLLLENYREAFGIEPNWNLKDYAIKGAESSLGPQSTATQEKKEHDFSLLTDPVLEQRTESSAKLLQEQRFNSEENETNE